jgi:hypothetical protein
MLPLLAACVACGTGQPASPQPADAAAPSFAAAQPAVYVAKVKNLLVGLPPTDAEVKAVEADPSQLGTLVDGWMRLPQYQAKMLRFFELAFQQTQVTIADFADQSYPHASDINATTAPLLVQNATESFARTVLELIAEGRPFTEAMTTTRFMMTPGLMEYYAFLDAWQVDDAGKVTDRFRAANPTASIYAEAAQGPIPIAESLDPTSANYMHWYDPDVTKAATVFAPGCAQDPIVFPVSGSTLHFLLLGGLDTHKNPAGTACGQYGGTSVAPQLTASDYSTWKMVTIRPPRAGESPTAFYDLPTLRSTSELVLGLPRVGFFTTPAFSANWQTNTSNQMRVTMNQALIVATGAQVDGTDPTVPTSTPGLDTTHSAPGSACVVCHRLLDPTRSVLSSTFSYYYHGQSDPSLSAQTGLFAFQGVVTPVASVAALGSTLASHPLVPAAWAQKLCYYENSAPCEANDPEFSRVVGVFKSSGYSWSALVRALSTSPLVTYAKPTMTAEQNGEVVAVARRDELCSALEGRLGLANLCALDALAAPTTTKTITEIVAGLPSDGYGRGAVEPVLPNQPTLFYRAGTENMCTSVAGLVIDAPAVQGARQWSSAQPDAAFDDFVSDVMGLTPSDPRSAAARTVLSSSFAEAQASGATASDALKSTFVVACLAPSVVGVGL